MKVTNESAKAGVVPIDATEREPNLKAIGGSNFDDWNTAIINQVLNATWFSYNEDNYEAAREKITTVLCRGLMGIDPKDEIEGMLAAQILATHQASMDCLRRAAMPNQTFEGRSEALNQANKLSRTYTTLLEALNRHRGKGQQQKIIVERVHVYPGAQAVVGSVSTGTSGWGGVNGKNLDQPYAVTYQPGQPFENVWSEDPGGRLLPNSADAERAMPTARRKIPRCAQGK